VGTGPLLDLVDRGIVRILDIGFVAKKARILNNTRQGCNV
jgi:hypothetical protein